MKELICEDKRQLMEDIYNVYSTINELNEYIDCKEGGDLQNSPENVRNCYLFLKQERMKLGHRSWMLMDRNSENE